MVSPFYLNMQHCIVDYPLEITSSEIITLAKPISVLLKAACLFGAPREIDAALQGIFDIGEEIASVEYGAYISGSQELNNFEAVSCRHLSPHVRELSEFFAPAAMATHFGKGIHIDSEKDHAFVPICKSWQSTSLVAFPLRIDREPVGTLVFGKSGSNPFTTAHVKLLWALAIQAENILLQNESMRALSFYSFLDPLTHLYNRRYFDNQLEKEIFRSLRSGKPFALLMLDLDGFKEYNDAFLHSAGDIALQEFAAILQATVREVDTVARLGGDEFAAILVESDAYGAQDLARRLIGKLAKHLMPGKEHTRTERLSASVGISTFPVDSFDKTDLLEKADRALYIAKSQGGGKVALYHEISDLLSLHSPPGELPIQKIFGAARSVVDMDRFLEILLFTAMKGLEADRGSIVVVDPRGNYCLRTAIGFDNGEKCLFPGVIVSPGSITTWVLEHKRPLVVSRQEDMPHPRQMKRNGYFTDSFLAIPLEDKGHLLGVLHLTNRRNGQPFTRQDLASFEPIASQIALILSQGMEFQENVKRFSTSILRSLSNALELRFPFLSGHSERVRNLCLRIGKRLDIGQEELSALETAASLHDIGIVGIPGPILSKNRKLTDWEMDVARKHPFLAYKLMEGIPGLDDSRRFILEHHEFFNGTGYPYGLRGEEISRGARILALAEFYDSITSERPHRGGLRYEEAIQLVKNNSETLFDDAVCTAFLEDLRASGNSSRKNR